MSMMSMKVVKRNGMTEEVSFDKVLTRIQLAAKDLEVNPTLIAQRTLLRIYDGGFRNSLLFCYKAEKAARKDLFGDDHR